jgi:hypothetical protein
MMPSWAYWFGQNPSGLAPSTWQAVVHACRLTLEKKSLHARVNHSKTQGTLEEGIVSKALDGIEVAFTHAQQGQIAFEDIAVGCTRAHGKLWINQGIDVDALEVFADKGQSGVGAEVVWQLFNNEVGHVWVHLQGEQYMRPKSLISMRKSTYFGHEVTDSGVIKIK